MRLDPATATVLVALIGAVATWLASRENRLAKVREQDLAREAQRRSDGWLQLTDSREAALEDVQRERDARRITQAHLELCIAALTMHGIPVPNRPTE